MAGIIEDSSILPVLAELAACLCAELEGQTACFCGIVIGDQEIPLDGGLYEGGEGCCGAGFVRLNSAFPSTQFPLVDQEATCFTSMAFDISVGILRCAPMGEDGNPPTQEELTAHAHLLLADMALIRRVLTCCLSQNKFPDLDQWVGTWTPLPNEGGISGSMQQVVVGELV